MKNFVKAMVKKDKGFLYLKKVFSQLTDAKLKESIFVSPTNKKANERQWIR